MIGTRAACLCYVLITNHSLTVSKSAKICPGGVCIACCANETPMGNADRFNPSKIPASRGTSISAASLQRVEAQSSRVIQPKPDKTESSDSREGRLEAPERWDGLS